MIYKTQEMSILRVENGQVPGLGQNPKALQIQVLPFLSHHSCSSQGSDPSPNNNHGLIRRWWLGRDYSNPVEGMWNQPAPLEHWDPTGAFHESWIQKPEQKLCNSSGCPTPTATVGSDTKGCCHTAREKKDRWREWEKKSLNEQQPAKTGSLLSDKPRVWIQIFERVSFIFLSLEANNKKAFFHFLLPKRGLLLWNK